MYNHDFIKKKCCFRSLTALRCRTQKHDEDERGQQVIQQKRKKKHEIFRSVPVRYETCTVGITVVLVD